MKFLLLALLIALHPTVIYPGQNVTLTVHNGNYLVTLVNDSTCFQNGKNKLVVGAGNYTIRTFYNCTPGYKYLVVKNLYNGSVAKYKFEVKTPSYEYFYSVVKDLSSKSALEEKELREVKELVKKLNVEVANLKGENKKLLIENKCLMNRIKILENSLNTLQDINYKLENSLRNKNKTLNDVLIKLSDTLKLVNYLKFGTLFFSSVFVGSYAAIIWRRWIK